MYRADLINASMGKHRLTNEQVAAKAGVTPKVVSAARNGKTSVTLPSLQAIAKALDLTMEELFAARHEAEAVTA